MKSEVSFYLQFVIALFWVLIGAFCAYTAKQKGRDYIVWFFIGLLFGIFGLIAILVLHPIQPQEELLEEEVPEKIPLIEDGWFYLDTDHQQWGPVSLEGLKTAWKEGAIDETSYVWSEGMADWMKIQDQIELLAYLDASSQ